MDLTNSTKLVSTDIQESSNPPGMHDITEPMTVPNGDQRKPPGKNTGKKTAGCNRVEIKIQDSRFLFKSSGT